MFHALVHRTALNTNKADLFFQNRIENGMYNPRDNAPLAILRAIIYPLLQDDEHLTVSEINFRNSGSAPWVLENDVCLLQHEDPNCTSEELDKTQAQYEAIGYIEYKNIRQYNKAVIDCRCLANPETKSSVFLSPKMSNTVYHRVLSGICYGVPWYIERKNKQWTDLEFEVIKSICGTASTRFVEAIAKAAQGYDFETKWVEKMLAGFERRSFDRQITNLENNMENIRRNIADYQNTISRMLQELRESEAKVLGYRFCAQEAPDNGILDYFKRNPNVHLESVEDDRIWFYVTTKLDGYDPDAAERAIIGSQGSLGIAGYYYSGGDLAAEKMQQVLKAIFIDQIMSIHVCAEYKLSSYPEMEGIAGADYPADIILHRMPNPHIHHYACTGGNAAPAREYLSKGNYIMAIEQCMYSASDLNFGDSSVMRRFMNSMYRNEYKCIELPDGTFTDTQGAWNWLEANKEKEE